MRLLTITLCLLLSGLLATQEPSDSEQAGTVTLAASAATPISQDALARVPGAVRVVTWNLQNFFDVYDDPYRRDEVTRPHYPSKDRRERVAEVLQQLDADVVCLQEIENRFVLDQFNSEFLESLGYQVVLVEGNDSRGIDVGVLSRLPIGAVTSYRHLRFADEEGEEQFFQRDLLRVHIGGALDADVYVVHLKSQHGGGAADRLRLAEARAAASILSQEMARDSGYRAILAGDFNDIPDSPPLQALTGIGLSDPCADSDAITYNKPPHLTRIDYLLLTPALAASSPQATVLQGERYEAASDHNPVVLDTLP